MFVNLMSALLRQPRRQGGVSSSLALFSILTVVLLAVFHLPVLAAGSSSKPSSFTARLINLEATAKETFRFNASLFNASKTQKVFEFKATLPAGWNVTFRVDGMQVTSYRIDSSRTQDVSIEITPSPEAKPGKYHIPVTATASDEQFNLDLEAVVKGAYAVEFTTPTGRLSDEVTEGSRKKIHLTVKNTGTLSLDGVEFSAQAPSKWSATFEPSKIERLEPGQSTEVTATLSVPDKTIAGDYMSNFTARNNNASSTAAFRITVTTSWLAGWAGVLIIFLAIGLVYYLIRKYGRR